jgi:hypothetical protein
MTATQQFIEDALAGGFAKDTVLGMRVTEVNGDNVLLREDAVTLTLRISQILLQPLAWQAVGTTRGWGVEEAPSYPPYQWHNEWHRFIDGLAEGKSIDEALQAIA